METPEISVQVLRQIRDECLCFAAQCAARTLARRFDRVFAPLGLTNTQFSMLIALANPQPTTMTDMARRMSMDQATCDALFATLAGRKLAALAADRAGVSRPHLTDAGLALVAKAVPLWLTEHDTLRHGLPSPAPDIAHILRQLG